MDSIWPENAVLLASNIVIVFLIMKLHQLTMFRTKNRKRVTQLPEKVDKDRPSCYCQEQGHSFLLNF